MKQKESWNSIKKRDKLNKYDTNKNKTLRTDQRTDPLLSYDTVAIRDVCASVRPNGLSYLCENSIRTRAFQLQDLERQMEEIEKKKQEAYEEFLKEKLMVDEVVRKLHEEDEKEAEEKMQKVASMKNFIDEFVKARAKWKDQEKEKMEEENK